MQRVRNLRTCCIFMIKDVLHMNELNQKAKLCATISLILLLFCSVLSMLVRIFPQPVMAIFHLDEVNRGMLLNPLMYLSAIISFAIFILLYCLLKSDMDGKTHMGGVLLILVLAYIGVMPFISLPLNNVTRIVLYRMTSASEVAAYSAVETVIAYIGAAGTLCRPLLAVAAALNWADSRIRSA